MSDAERARQADPVGLREAAQALVDEWDAAMAGDMPLNGHYQKQALDRLRAALAVEPGPLASDSAQRLAKVIEQAEATNPEWARGARFVVGWYPAQPVEPGPLDVEPFRTRWPDSAVVVTNDDGSVTTTCAWTEPAGSTDAALAARLSPDKQPKGAG